jgi:hypothetical protein
MRVGRLDPTVFDDFVYIVYEGLLDAAYAVKDNAVRNLRSKIGIGKTKGINRPIYKTGKYAGKYWTAREFGNLIKSIRVVEKTSEQGKIVDQKNVRVYAGTKMAYYASIFEYGSKTAFLRPAFYKTVGKLAVKVQERINRGR